MSINGRENWPKPRAGGIQLIRWLVGQGTYDWSEKVQTLIQDGWFEPEDLEVCVATGTVTKTQKDELRDSVGEKKYVILGRDRSGYSLYTVGKIKRGPAGRLYFFITAHGAKRG